MFRLRKIYPPFGTEITPLWEFAYSEQVKVINGLCEVQDPVTRDYLLNMGYQQVDEIVPLSEQPVTAKPVESKGRGHKSGKGRS